MSHRRISLGALCLAAGLSGCSGGDDTAPLDIAPPGRAPFEPPGFTPLERPDTPGNTLLFRFNATDVVETFGGPGGHFLVHFTRSGSNAVPAKDDNGSGVPDFVEEVDSVYEQVLSHYKANLGFRAPLGDEVVPDNGGDGRFDVYLVDFGKAADGNFVIDGCLDENHDACIGYMVQENDYAGYGYPSTLVANRILGSHEFFHAIQAAYDAGQGRVISEGTAVWGTETFDPTLNDFEGFVDGYLESPDHSLNLQAATPTDPFSYGSALFFQFLEERYGKGTIRQLWERCENGANGNADPDWFTELDPLLTAPAKTTFADAFVEFATYNLFTGKFADPSRSYASGAGYPEVKIADFTDPSKEAKPRFFYASTQYHGIAPEDRAAMTAALVSPDPAQTDGLTVLLAVQRGSTYDPLVKLTDVRAGTQAVDTGGADRFVVAVVNGLTQGDSRRPWLCVGTVDEVAACRTALLGPSGGAGGSGGGGGAGGAGGGSAADTSSAGGTGGGSGISPPPEDTAGCGCRQAPTAPLNGLPLGAAALAALAVCRLTRARRHHLRARGPSPQT